MDTKDKALAVAGLLTGAMVWGVIWYPYRALEGAGVGGAFATLATYSVALAIGLGAFGGELRRLRPSWLLTAIALSAGWTNLAFVLAVIHGEVVRVMLLFYLAPLWTVLFARLLLEERPGLVGALVIWLSLAGAVVMLWNPALGLPVPADTAEWLGLSAGLMFALSNVLARKARHYTVSVKSVAVWFGVSATCVAYGWFQPVFVPPAAAFTGATLALIVLLGGVLFALNLVVQYGLAHTPANQAIVILLSELVFAALSAHFLAGETMGVQEWAGGTLIVVATLLSGRLEAAVPRAEPSTGGA